MTGFLTSLFVEKPSFRSSCFFLIVVALLARLRAALALQAFLAETDGLTGILNARAFRQRCEAHENGVGFMHYGHGQTAGSHVA